VTLGDHGKGVEVRDHGRNSLQMHCAAPQIRSAPDPKDPGRPNSPPPELLTPDYVVSDPEAEFHS